MSDTSSLTELARFVGSSVLSSDDPARSRIAVNAIAARLAPSRQRGVSELLAAVLALSARTRRMVMPKVEIELDVFAPDNRRAVKLTLPRG